MLTWNVRVSVVSVCAGRECLDESVISACPDITTSHKMVVLVSIFNHGFYTVSNQVGLRFESTMLHPVPIRDRDGHTSSHRPDELIV